MREQIRTGEYPVAAESDVDHALAEIRKERFANDMQYQQALKKYGVTEAELKDRLSWQLTVMHFIDARFRPAVVVSDQDVQRYYDTHRAELNRQREPELFTILADLGAVIVGQRPIPGHVVLRHIGRECDRLIALAAG